MSKLLSIIGHSHSATREKQFSRTTDELCHRFSVFPSNVFIVLDNADNLFQGSEQTTSQDVLDQLGKCLFALQERDLPMYHKNEPK